MAGILAAYKECALTTPAEGLVIERRMWDEWYGRQFDPAEVERRRAGVVARDGPRRGRPASPGWWVRLAGFVQRFADRSRLAIRTT